MFPGPAHSSLFDLLHHTVEAIFGDLLAFSFCRVLSCLVPAMSVFFHPLPTFTGGVASSTGSELPAFLFANETCQSFSTQVEFDAYGRALRLIACLGLTAFSEFGASMCLASHVESVLKCYNGLTHRAPSMHTNQPLLARVSSSQNILDNLFS